VVVKITLYSSCFTWVNDDALGRRGSVYRAKCPCIVVFEAGDVFNFIHKITEKSYLSYGKSGSPHNLSTVQLVSNKLVCFISSTRFNKASFFLWQFFIRQPRPQVFLRVGISRSVVYTSEVKIMNGHLITYGKLSWSVPSWQKEVSSYREARGVLSESSREAVFRKSLQSLSKEERQLLRAVLQTDSSLRACLERIANGRSFLLFGPQLRVHLLQLVCRILKGEDDLEAARILRWLVVVIDSGAFLALTVPVKHSVLRFFQRSPYSIREQLAVFFGGISASSGALLNPSRFGEQSLFEAFLVALDVTDSQGVLADWKHRAFEILEGVRKTVNSRMLSDVRKRSYVRSETVKFQREITG
jgi:hypothetical protein